MKTNYPDEMIDFNGNEVRCSLPRLITAVEQTGGVSNKDETIFIEYVGQGYAVNSEDESALYSTLREAVQNFQKSVNHGMK